MAKHKTNAIRGIFVCLILFSHLRGYLQFGENDYSMLDSAFDLVMNFLGQLIVVVYFFYSGYGIIEQYKAKKREYLRSFPYKRLFKTWIHFALAVLLFLILQTTLGHYYSSFEYAFCWIGWTSIGNSNWFVFDIQMLYSITYLTLFLADVLSRDKRVVVSMLCVGTVILWLFLRRFRIDSSWWYNTLIAFPFGAIFSIIREDFDRILYRRFFLRILALGFILVFFLLWRFFIGIDIYGVCSIIFMSGIILISSFVCVDNKILQWLGTHCFSIYILQRIPMILFKHIGIENHVVYTFSVIVSALLIAWLFDIAMSRLDSFLFKKKSLYT